MQVMMVLDREIAQWLKLSESNLPVHWAINILFCKNKLLLQKFVLAEQNTLQRRRINHGTFSA